LKLAASWETAKNGLEEALNVSTHGLFPCARFYDLTLLLPAVHPSAASQPSPDSGAGLSAALHADPHPRRRHSRVRAAARAHDDGAEQLRQLGGRARAAASPGPGRRRAEHLQVRSLYSSGVGPGL
jgi:hypothetical protein